MGVLGTFITCTLTITYWSYTVKILDGLQDDWDDNRWVFWLGVFVLPWIFALIWLVELIVIASFLTWYFWLKKDPKAKKIGEILFGDEGGN